MGLVQVLKGGTGHRSRPGRRRSVLALLALGMVPVGLSACGSSSASGSSTSTTRPSGTASEMAYVACLKQHGVTLPAFGHGPGGTPPTGGTRPTFTPGSGTFTPGSHGGFAANPKFAAAAAACKNLRPKGGFGRFGGAGGFNSTAFAAYRNCLKLHGVTLPTGGRQPTGSTPPTTFDQSSPTVQAALQACAALRPTASTTTTTAAG